MVIAACGVDVYQRVVSPPDDFFQWAYTTRSPSDLLTSLRITLVTGVLFGVAPAIRLSKLDINAV